MTKAIYSATVYKYNKNGQFISFVKAPCTSKKAAEEYAKVLAVWWGDEYKTMIIKDYPCNIATAKALQKMPPF